MKRILYILPFLAIILLLNLVSASWWDNYDYYNSHNYNTLYDMFNNQNNQGDSNHIYVNSQKQAVVEENHDWYNVPKNVVYYTVDQTTWLNKKDISTENSDIAYVNSKNNHNYYQSNDYNDNNNNNNNQNYYEYNNNKNNYNDNSGHYDNAHSFATFCNEIIRTSVF